MIPSSSNIESKVYEVISPGKIHLKEELLQLDQLGSKQVAAKTLFSAISPGTEVAAYRGDPPLRPMKVYPRLVGYCNIAEVVATGSEVSHFRVGDKILTFQSHRSAFICSEDSIVAKVPSSIRPQVASTAYLFHLGYNALLKGGFQPGFNVAVVGLGTLGLTTVALACAFGGKVFALSSQRELLELAEKFGAFRSYSKADPNLRAGLLEATDRVGIDLVVTTSGSWGDWELAVSIARKEGTVAVLGFPGRMQPVAPFNPIDSKYFYDSQLKLVSCGYTPDVDLPPSDIRFTIKRNCRFLLDLIEGGRLPAERVALECIHWTKIDQAYERLMKREPGLLTIVLDWTF